MKLTDLFPELVLEAIHAGENKVSEIPGFLFHHVHDELLNARNFLGGPANTT